MLREKYAQEIESLLKRYPAGREKSAVLPLLHIAQQEYGYASPEAIADVASILNLDPTHVLSIAGFYSLYYEEPVGKYVLEICNDLPCALRGADQFIEMACQKLGVKKDEITADGLFTIKNVMCLAACDRAPMLQCNLRYEENLTEEKFDALIARLRREAASNEKPATVVDKILVETHH
ncbi:MAG: NAD(P)H-dependent oxidoreductase subunit E [Chloroflexi bacterium]|nr:NAD(P)H-dependent oxidoreductase subunit E [Chloroflexota bacterium]MDA0243323.1 NAD(P)H-dependent oxidoreductase subunit E [Chloroflexota bacterium]